jgi:hypothetical protein
LRLESLSAASAYTPPEPLLALHMLDFVELCGSQSRAARALAVHQSTVSRSAAWISEQFRLRPSPPGGVIRYGSNDCLRLMRQAAQAHRRMQGLLRIGVDPLHQPLLAGLAGVLPVPPRFRPADHWAELIDQRLLDGAILSSWCHPGPLQADADPHWPRRTAVPLGRLPLQLVCPMAPAEAPRRQGAVAVDSQDCCLQPARRASAAGGQAAATQPPAALPAAAPSLAGAGAQLAAAPVHALAPADAMESLPAAHEPATPPATVLLPHRGVVPLLHELFLHEGFRVEVQPLSCQEPAAWLKRLRDRQLGMPLCPPLLDPHWFQAQGLISHPAQPRLQQRLPERLWLLLSEELWRHGEADGCPLAHQLVQALRQRLEHALQAAASDHS